MEVWGEGGGEVDGCGGLHSHAEVGGDLGLLATEGGGMAVGSMGLGRSAMEERMVSVSGM